MKILVLSNVPTHPITAGNRKAIFNQVELFKQLGHNVSLLYVKEMALIEKGNNDCSDMKNYWGERLYYYKVSKIEHILHLIKQRFRRIFQKGVTKVDDYYPVRLNSFIKNLHRLENFDCIIANYYFFTKAFSIKGIPLKGLYTHDYFAYKSMLVDNNKVGYNTDANQEAKAMQRSPHIFALNTEEAIYFSKLSPHSKVYNTFSHYQFNNTPIECNKKILFFSGDNAFNISGLNWFLDEVYPKILHAVPDIELVIGGSICKILQVRDIPNCSLVGYVENPIDFYMLGDIVINPTYEGTGLKIKTFEAISYGKVVIAHPHSATGIFDKEHAPVYSSTNPIEWVNFIRNTIQNPSIVLNIKKADEDYIYRMNAYIENEYKTFFSSKII